MKVCPVTVSITVNYRQSITVFSALNQVITNSIIISEIF